MTHSKKYLSALGCLVLLFSTSAVIAADVAKGQSLYGTCVACHGAKGEGNPALNSPALAGQDASYVVRQLNNFKTGIRGANPKDMFGAQMRPMAMMLTSEESVNDVAAFIASLAAVKSTMPTKGDVHQGQSLYHNNCGACHGNKAEGNPAFKAPALTGQSGKYLLLQMKNFQNGVRGTHQEDKLGRQMAMMANTVKDDAKLNNIIAFIQSLDK